MMNNLCKENLMNNVQKGLRHQEYQLNNLFACSDIGLVRTNQEDSIIIDYHPLNKTIKLMAIADGMGGLNYGAKASNLTLKIITKWFENLPKYILNNNNILSYKTHEVILLIDDIIRNTCDGGGTTLALSIINDLNAFFLNIGDSRIYIKNQEEFYQLSKDHSITWKLLEKGIIKRKDDMLFHKKNNLITSRLGCEKRLLKIDDFFVDNDKYDEIYLFSDGITDCLNDEAIRYITDFDSANPAGKFIDYSLKNNIKQNFLNNKYYYNEVTGGKDNASSIVYIKRKEAHSEI